MKNAMSWTCSTHVVVGRCVQHFNWKPWRKRPLGTPRRRFKYNIKIDVKEIVSEGMEWVQMAQDKIQWRTVVFTVMKLRVP